MKRIGYLALMSLIAAASFGGSWIYEDQRNSSIPISAIGSDSSSDSSAAGLILVANHTMRLEESGWRNKSLNGAFIVEPSTETAHGFGLADSAFMSLQTFGMGFAAVTLDSRGQAGLPCTLWVNLANVNDTLFKRHLQFVVKVLDTVLTDSLGDSITTANGTAIAPYKVRWEMIGRD